MKNNTTRGERDGAMPLKREIVYNLKSRPAEPRRLMAHAPTDPRISVDYDPRTRVLYGCGVVELLPDCVQPLGSRVLIVTDAGLAAAGHLDRVLKSLAGNSTAVYDQVHANPTTADVEQCAAFARQTFEGRGPEVVIGLGGGSSMDCAKGTLFLLAGGGTMHDYRGVGKGVGEFLPLITIPTTSGTGSEAQSFAVISDADSHLKMACGDKRAAAKVALLDPTLTLTMPAYVTAVTGIDAISHAVETFVTSARTPFSQMYSRQAWRLLSTAFPIVIQEPENLDARGDMLLGAHLAGAAIEASMLGATHAMANPLTAHFDVTHGVAVGLMLPSVVRFNAADPKIAELYSQMAAAVGSERSPEALAIWLETAVANAGLGRSLGELRVGETAIDKKLIPTMSSEATEQMTGRFNPRPVAVDDFASLYDSAW